MDVAQEPSRRGHDLRVNLPPPLAAQAAAQGGPFTTAQALAAGFDEREILRRRKTGTWTRLRRGVYVETALVSDDEVLHHLLHFRAALLCLQAPVTASHITSAALHRVALLDPDFSLVHITREGSGSARIEAGIQHHDAALPASQLTKVDGLVTTSAARTVLDLARELPFDAGLIAAESALNKRLTTKSELRELLEYCLDWPGARTAGRVVAFASPYSESPGESMGRIAFDELGVPPPSQQVLIFDACGFVARSDFCWEEHRTVGEQDGRLKYVGENATADVLYREKLREDRLRAAGLEVFRFGWQESYRRSPSLRSKAFAAFDRAARSPAPRYLRFQRQPPPE